MAGLSLADVAASGLPLDLILEQLVQLPDGDHAEDIINLGAGMDRAFRDRLRESLSRRNNPLFRHLSADDITHLSRVIGGRVAETLEKYKAQFPTRYRTLFAGLRPNVPILRELLGQTDLLTHRYYRDIIERTMMDWMIRADRFAPEWGWLTPMGDSMMDMLRLMHVVGCRLDGIIAYALQNDNQPLARVAIEQWNQRVMPLDVVKIFTWNFFSTRPEFFRLLAQHAGVNIDGRVREGMRRIVSLYGQPGSLARIQQIVAQMRPIVYEMFQRERSV